MAARVAGAVAAVVLCAPAVLAAMSAEDMWGFGRSLVDPTVTGYADAVLPLADGGYVLAGAAVPVADYGSEGVETLPKDAYLARYDARGERAWLRLRDWGPQDGFSDVVAAPGGLLVAVGERYDGAYASTGIVEGWGDDAVLRWQVRYDHPGATMTALEAAAVDGDAVRVVGFVSVPDGGASSVHAILLTLGLDGTLRGVAAFPQLGSVQWLDVARLGPDTFAVAGALGGPLGLGRCAGVLVGAEVAWHVCQDGQRGWAAVAAGPQGLVAAGWDRSGGKTYAASQHWDAPGGAQWLRALDPADPASDRRAADLAVGPDGTVYVAIINGSLPSTWTLAAPRLVAGVTGALLATQVAAYRPDGTGAWTVDHREAAHHVYPLAAAVEHDGTLLLAGARSDPATLDIHPMAMRVG